MGPEQKIVFDIRYSINYFPNSVTAAEFAEGKMGGSRILVDVLYSPAADEDDEDCFLLPPPLTPEYELLVDTSWSNWYYEYVISRQFTVPDLLDELFAVAGIRQYWMRLKSGEDAFSKAVDKLASCLPADVEGILVSEQGLGALPQGIVGCDPTGLQKYTLIDRPESISEDAALMAKKPPIVPMTFSLSGHPSAEYVTLSLP